MIPEVRTAVVRDPHSSSPTAMPVESNTRELHDNARTRSHLPHWGWFLAATAALVALLPVLSIWLPFHREQQAVARIERFARSIEKTTVEPEWLRPLLERKPKKWPNVFERVTNVNLAGSEIKDVEFASVGAFTKLDRLWANETQVTDSGLANISGLAGLESLWLDNTRISDRGIAHLKRLTNLKRLSLSGTDITDSAVVHMTGMTKLESLWLDRTQITNVGLQRLQEALPNCITLPP
jgi:Leucine-rich repeat (LRR) protein